MKANVSGKPQLSVRALGLKKNLRVLVFPVFALVARRLPQLTAAIELVNEISKQLTERKSQAVSEISSTFDELEKALHQRKTALITEVENICTTKQKVSGEARDRRCVFSFISSKWEKQFMKAAAKESPTILK